MTDLGFDLRAECERVQAALVKAMGADAYAELLERASRGLRPVPGVRSPLDPPISDATLTDWILGDKP